MFGNGYGVRVLVEIRLFGMPTEKKLIRVALKSLVRKRSGYGMLSKHMLRKGNGYGLLRISVIKSVR